MLGIASAGLATLTARLAVPLGANYRREDFLRAECRHGSDGELEVEPFAQQDSSMMSLLARDNCLVIRPPLAPAAQAGDRVAVIPFAAGLLGI
jgi:molybdopterin molybdotransferase